jgi:hypothetical protein
MKALVTFSLIPRRSFTLGISSSCTTCTAQASNRLS